MPPAPPKRVNPHRGRRLGKYEILTQLSIGGMAEIFLAFVRGPGGFKKFVVIKQILPDIRADESFVRMFLDEARITAALSHANIGQVYDLAEEPESHDLYLAMEFIAGQNLEQLYARAAARGVGIPVAFSARVVRDVCLGLHYAHHFRDQVSGERTPVIHRDVSPKNVMITYAGTVKVIDFGIAKAMGRLNRTQIGIVKGTSGYMAPEQVRNEALDGRADLFSAAVMLYEFLSGERLFSAQDDFSMMKKIIESDVPPLRKVNPAIAAPLSDVVAKGLARSRNDRWASGKDFALAIESACPTMFDDDQVADFMGSLFADKVKQTRSLLELAEKAKSPNDVAIIAKVAKSLTGEVAEVKVAVAAPKGRRAPRAAPISDDERTDQEITVAQANELDRGTIIQWSPPAGDRTAPPIDALQYPTEPDGLPKPNARRLVLSPWKVVAFVSACSAAVLGALVAWFLSTGSAVDELVTLGTGSRTVVMTPSDDGLSGSIAGGVDVPKSGEAILDAGQNGSELRHASVDVPVSEVKNVRVASSDAGVRRSTSRSAVEGMTREPVQVIQTPARFSLATIHPSEVTVMLDGVPIGSTPLHNVEILPGTHAIELIDGQSQRRMMSISVVAGEDLNLKGVDVSSLPLMP